VVRAICASSRPPGARSHQSAQPFDRSVGIYGGADEPASACQQQLHARFISFRIRRARGVFRTKHGSIRLSPLRQVMKIRRLNGES
jgi:hypothetical protein